MWPSVHGRAKSVNVWFWLRRVCASVCFWSHCLSGCSASPYVVIRPRRTPKWPAIIHGHISHSRVWHWHGVCAWFCMLHIVLLLNTYYSTGFIRCGSWSTRRSLTVEPSASFFIKCTWELQEKSWYFSGLILGLVLYSHHQEARDRRLSACHVCVVLPTWLSCLTQCTDMVYYEPLTLFHGHISGGCLCRAAHMAELPNTVHRHGVLWTPDSLSWSYLRWTIVIAEYWHEAILLILLK